MELVNSGVSALLPNVVLAANPAIDPNGKAKLATLFPTAAERKVLSNEYTGASLPTFAYAILSLAKDNKSDFILNASVNTKEAEAEG